MIQVIRIQVPIPCSITRIITSYTSTTVSGTVCNNCEVHIYQAFNNPAANGGGGAYLARTTANSSGVWTASIPTGYTMGDLTFVAYDPSTGDTSEMSPRYQMYVPLIIKP